MSKPPPDLRMEELRAALDIDEATATDEEIWEVTEGSLLRAGVEFRHACRQFAAPLLDLSERLLTRVSK